MARTRQKLLSPPDKATVLAMYSAAGARGAVLGKPRLEMTFDSARIQRYERATAYQMIETPWGPIILIQPIMQRRPRFYIREARHTIPDAPRPRTELCFGFSGTENPLVASFPHRLAHWPLREPLEIASLAAHQIKDRLNNAHFVLIEQVAQALVHANIGACIRDEALVEAMKGAAE